ncbi:MAG TPA: WD40 repeat domain-containing protein [Gemmataceae bacterium]|nr:WD40 repeat domain-containing protein [Gemmataceae bacterium]
MNPAGEGPPRKTSDMAPEPAGKPPAREQRVRTDRLGDPLPEGALARLGTGRFRSGFMMYQAAFSPDGRIVAGASAGGGIALWDVANGKEVQRFLGYKHVYALAFSPDGKMLACPEQQIHLYDTSTGEKMRTLSGHEGGMTMSLAFSADGKLLASGGHDNLVRLWDVASGHEIRKLAGHQKGIYGLAFSPDGTTLVSHSHDGTVRVWNPQTGKQRGSLPAPPAGFSTFAMSADGKQIAMADEGGAIRIWSLANLKVVQVIQAADRQVGCLAFSPDSQALASGHGDGTIAVWQVATGKPLARWQAHAFMVKTLAFSPQSKLLVSGAFWESGVRLWEAATGKEVQPLPGHHASVDVVVYEPDGKGLITGSRDKTIVRWDLANGQSRPWLDWHAPAMDRFALSPDRKMLATWEFSPGCIRLRNPAGRGEGRLLGTFESRPTKIPTRPLTFSPDGTRLAAICRDGVLRQWDAVNGVLLWENRVRTNLGAIAFSPDGKMLASASWAGGDTTIRLCDTETGKEIRVCANGSVVGELAFSPDGRILAAAAGSHNRASLWDVASGKELRSLTGLQKGVHALDFSPDGRVIAATGIDDHAVRVWEVATGEAVRQFPGPFMGGMSVVFAPDGRTLASGGVDSTILIWDLTGRLKDGALQPMQLTADGLERRWSDLAANAGPRAFQAVWDLAACPRLSVPFLQGKLRPARPPDEARIARAIGDLDDGRFAVREKATTELQKIVDVAEPALRKRLDNKPPLEVQQRIEVILRTLDPSRSSERLRLARAVQALEYTGASEARKFLQTLAEGAPAAVLTREAKTALDRLSRVRAQN